jgi:hypothetical protein
MSTYLTAEEVVLTLCRSFNEGTTFNEANSRRDDWSVIDNKSGIACVVTMGGESVEGDNLGGRGSQGMLQERHQIKITLVKAVGTGEKPIDARVVELKETTEALKHWLRQHDRLGIGAPISRAIPSRTSMVFERVPKGAGYAGGSGAPTHILQDITLTVWCDTEDEGTEGGY